MNKERISQDPETVDSSVDLPSEIPHSLDTSNGTLYQEFIDAILHLNIQAPPLQNDEVYESEPIYQFGDVDIESMDIPKYYAIEGFRAPPPTLEAAEDGWTLLGEPFLSSEKYDSGVPASPIQMTRVHLNTVHSVIYSQFKVRFRSSKGNSSQVKDYFYSIVNDLYKSCLAYGEAFESLENIETNMNKLYDSLWKPVQRELKFPSQACADGITFTPKPFEYEIYVFNDASFQQIGELIHLFLVQFYKECGSQKLAIELARARIDMYLEDFLYYSPFLGKIPPSDHLNTFMTDDDILPLDQQELDKAKHYVDVLFYFLRQSSIHANSKFSTFIVDQISKVIAPMLHITTLKTQAFIIHQLVQCTNLDERCLGFIQLPTLESREQLWKYAGEYIYKLTIFFSPMINLPVDDITEDTKAILDVINPTTDEENVYVLCEPDYMQLFTQFQFSDFLKTLFSEVQSDDINGSHTVSVYEAILNISEDLVSVFSEAVVHFQYYKHFSNRIADAMIHLLNHLGTYSEALMANGFQMTEMFKTRVDRLFVFAFNTFFHQSHLWQFLVSMPYKYLYRSSAVYMFLTIYLGRAMDLKVEQNLFHRFEEWIKDRLKDTKREDFAQYIAKNSHGEFLLHALAHLSVSHSYDVHLVLTIIYEIYMVSQVIDSSKELYAKFSLPILGYIFSERPKITSFLLRLMNSTEDLDSTAVRIFNFIPLDRFQPTEDDISVLSDWLRMEDITSPNILMALMVIDGINWEYEGNGTFQDPTIHQLTTIALAKAVLFNKEMMPYLLKSGRTRFKHLAEDRIFLMKHFNRLGHQLVDYISLNEQPIAKFYEILQTQKSMDPVLAYVVLQISDIMSTLTSIESKGLPILKQLIYQRNYRSVLRLIYDHTPGIARMMQHQMHSNIHFFHDVCLPILSTNTSLWSLGGGGDHRMVTFLISLIAKQLSDFAEYSDYQEFLFMLQYWCHEGLNEHHWYRNPFICSILDSVFKSYFLYHENDDSLSSLLHPLESTPWDTLYSSLPLKPNTTMLGNILGNKRTKIEHIYLMYALLIHDVVRVRKKWSQVDQLDPHQYTQLETQTQKLACIIIQTIESISSNHPLYTLFWQLFCVVYFTYTPSGVFLAHSILSYLDRRKKVKMKSLEDIQRTLSQLSNQCPDRKLIYLAMMNWFQLNLSQIPIPIPYEEDIFSLAKVCHFTGLGDTWLQLMDQNTISLELQEVTLVWASESKTISTVKSKPSHRSQCKSNLENIKPPPPIQQAYTIRVQSYSINREGSFERMTEDIDNVLAFDANNLNTRVKEHYNTMASYANLFRQKYVHVSKIEMITMRCPINCRGPATFNYQYNIPKKTPEFALGLPKYVRSLNMYNTLSKLSFEPILDSLLRLDKTFIEKKDSISSADGLKLFKWIRSKIVKIENHFSPVRRSLEYLMGILYRHHIIHEPSELKNTLEFILSSSKNDFMIPLFQPNLSVEDFLPMYTMVLSKYKAIRDRVSLPYLLKRFKVDSWIEHAEPEYQRELMRKISNFTISFLNEKESNLLSILQSHVETIFHYKFPLHLNSIILLALEKKDAKFTDYIWPLILRLPFESLTDDVILALCQIISQSAKEAVSNLSAFPNFQKLVEILVQTLVSKTQVDVFRLEGIILNVLLIYEIWIQEFTHHYVMEGLISCMNVLIDFTRMSLTHMWRWFTQFACGNPLKLWPQALQTLFATKWAEIPWEQMENAPETVLASVYQICNLYRGKPLFSLVTHILTLVAKPMESDSYLRLLLETSVLITSAHPWPLSKHVLQWLYSLYKYPWYCMQGSEIMKSEVIKEFLYKYTQPPALVPQEKPTQSKGPRVNALLIPIQSDSKEYTDEDSGRLHLALRLIRHAHCWEYAINPNLNPILAAGIVDLLVLYISFTRNLLPFCLSSQAKFILNETYQIIKNISHVLLIAHPEGSENFHKVCGTLMMLLQESILIFNTHISTTLYDIALLSLYTYLESEPTLAWMVMKVATTINILPTQIRILEKCIEVDVNHYHDWVRVASNILIPVIQQQEYIQHCLDLKSGYMLYVHVIQWTHRFQTPNDLLNFLNEVQKWTTFVGGSLDHKSILLYLKIIRTIIQGFKVCDHSDHLSLQFHLEHYFEFFDYESKGKEGFWVALGLGGKTQTPTPFRVVTRYIVLYLMHQLPLSESKGFVRLSNKSPLYNQSQRVKKMVQMVSYEKETKPYAKWALPFIEDMNHTIHDLPNFVMMLVKYVYDKDVASIFEKMI